MEKYKPSKEGMAKAEGMMTPGEKKFSENREEMIKGEEARKKL